MLVSDRDVLAREPRLFDEVRFAAQRVVGESGASLDATATVLTLSGVDVSAAGVSAGNVAVLSELGAVEITGVSGAATVNVSRLRADASSPAVGVGGGANWSGTAGVWTFGPQIAIAERRVLDALDLSAPGEETGVDGVRERYPLDAVVALGPLKAAAALGALEVIYRAGAEHGGAHGDLAAKAERYAELFAASRARLVALIDSDGDGEADTVRHASASQLRRG